MKDICRRAPAIIENTNCAGAHAKRTIHKIVSPPPRAKIANGLCFIREVKKPLLMPDRNCNSIKRERMESGVVDVA
jgi:hypothetical protein